VPHASAAPPSSLTKEKIAPPLRLLRSEASQLVHRKAGPALLTDQDIARDGVLTVKLATTPVERQPLAMVVLIDQQTVLPARL
jgi:hypothetical protein